MTGPVPPTLRFNAICVFIDAVEFCGPDAREFAAPLLPVQLEHLMSDHLPLRQPCAYGLGQLAEVRRAAPTPAPASAVLTRPALPPRPCLRAPQHAPDALRPRAAEVARQLVAVIQAPGAREEDALASFTENAVSTLMKLAQHLPDAVDARALTAVWLQQLPLRVDEAEARINHALLVKLARAQSPQLLGCAPDALAQVVRVLAELLTLRAEDEEMATPHTWCVARGAAADAAPTLQLTHVSPRRCAGAPCRSCCAPSRRRLRPPCCSRHGACWSPTRRRLCSGCLQLPEQPRPAASSCSCVNACMFFVHGSAVARHKITNHWHTMQASSAAGGVAPHSFDSSTPPTGAPSRSAASAPSGSSVSRMGLPPAAAAAAGTASPSASLERIICKKSSSTCRGRA